MENILQNITLAARTLQGIAPIFVEYALSIAIIGFFVFALGELLANIFSYRDVRTSWIAKAFQVHESQVLPIPSSYTMGLETSHPSSGIKNPYALRMQTPAAHQSDYLVRGERGSTVVSVYNWRGTRSSSAKSAPVPGYVKSPETEKNQLTVGFRKQIRIFSPDEDAKAKAATLNAALVSKFGSRSRATAMCLHKNRPPSLVTRSPARDFSGKLAAHIDIEQISHSHLPTGSGGQIDEETWHDLRSWFLRQPSRMMHQSRLIGRIMIMLCLLAVYSETESTTISSFEIEILQERLTEIFGIVPSRAGYNE